MREKALLGTFLVDQWWRLCTSSAGKGGVDSIPALGIKIPYVMGHSQKKKKKKKIMEVNPEVS